MNIGIFDSGIGGLSIARTFLYNSTANVMYVADSANMPYGDKSPEHIYQISSTIVRFLELHNVDHIIIGCHTASVLAGKKIKQLYNYIPITTMQELTIQQALATTKNGTIGLIATLATIQSNVYRQAFLSHNGKICFFEQACPTLAPSIEQYFDKPEILQNVIDMYLHNMLENQIDTLILGSTHYSLIKNLIGAYAPDISLISSDEICANQLKIEPNCKTGAQNKHRFFVSGDRKAFEKKLEFFLNLWNIKNICYTVETTPWKVIQN